MDDGYRGGPPVGEPEPEPEPVADPSVVDVFAVSGKVNAKAPFRADGCSVLDADGDRLAICGRDHNRPVSGPDIAQAVAFALNRFNGR